MLVTIPKPRDARARASFAAPAAPPPSHSTGRRAAASASASVSRATASGSGRVTPSGASEAGLARDASWMSTGISTLTGPPGGVRAVRAASRSAPGRSAAPRTRSAAFDAPRSMVSWSRASWI